MVAVVINVEVHCTAAPWAIQNPNPKYNDIKYRIYVNDELIIERNWIWGNTTFLKENIAVFIDYTTSLTLKLEPVLFSPTQAVVTLKNLHLANKGVTIDSIEDTSICFKVYKYKIKERSDETRRIFERRRSRSINGTS
jgi:hypothetical protein